jgi:glycosyltransferase involved in cell wall biosynthesis
MGDLKARAAAEGLVVSTKVDEPADVCFTGAADNPFEPMRLGDIFFPSRYEGFPNALMEAMYAGIPAISADCPTGPEELIAGSRSTGDMGEEDAGILLPVPDPNSEVDLQRWADAITFLSAQPEARAKMIERGRRRVEEFSAAVIRTRWMHAIDDAHREHTHSTKAGSTTHKSFRAPRANSGSY